MFVFQNICMNILYGHELDIFYLTNISMHLVGVHVLCTHAHKSKYEYKYKYI